MAAGKGERRDTANAQEDVTGYLMTCEDRESEKEVKRNLCSSQYMNC